MAAEPVFHESRLGSTPIKQLGLKIEGTQLEPLLKEFEQELRGRGFTRLRPRFYLSTEWGVSTGTVAIGIPFYLARPDLIALHQERVGHVEGAPGPDILRYLRHEMGHVVNYAYFLYEQEEWVRLFGSFTQPYVDDYRPVPFSRRYVRHLPGWYAQKHPDEDWAETFAVWMTPGGRWPTEYADRPQALAKLNYCDRTMQACQARDPIGLVDIADEDVSELTESVDEYYGKLTIEGSGASPGLDGALRAVFESMGTPVPEVSAVPKKKASSLIRGYERDLMSSVFCWTGHFPERTRALLRSLAQRADAIEQAYPENLEPQALLALTTLVTALAMNHVYRGDYIP
jgi:hypothetical protein